MIHADREQSAKTQREAPIITAAEYAEKVRMFMISSYCWQNLVTSAALARLPHQRLTTGIPAQSENLQQPRAGQQEVNLQRQQAEADEGGVFLVPPIWKRLVAEGIDFIFLLLLKILVTLAISEYINIMDIPADLDLDNVFEKMDYETAYVIAGNLFTLEILHKSLVITYEAFFLASGQRFGNATPGKAMMGIRVLRCRTVSRIGPGMVRVQPATDLGVWRSLLRALLKCLGSTLFFPSGIPFFIVAFNRTIYDVLSESIVVH